MTSRSYKYFQNKKDKPLIFSRPVPSDKGHNFTRIWEDNLLQSIDYKPQDGPSYDGSMLSRFLIDELYPFLPSPQ